MSYTTDLIERVKAEPLLANSFDIREAQAPNIIVVKPHLSSGDPYNEASQIMRYNWRRWIMEHYGIQTPGTLVVDTMTAYAEEITNMSADNLTYSRKNPITFGSGDDQVVIPAEGDYGVGQRLSMQLTKKAWDQPMDVCFIGHTGVEARGKRGGQGDKGYEILRAGFALVGQATVAKYGGKFDTYIRTKIESYNKENYYVAQLRPDAIYGAGGRGNTFNVPFEVTLKQDWKSQTDFWRERVKELRIDLEDEAKGYFRVALYGEPKTGKTWLAFHMLRRPIIYVAVDEGSEFLRSCPQRLLDATELVLPEAA